MDNICAFYINNESEIAVVHDYAAHLTRWRTKQGTDWIFTSRKALFQTPKSIRGGVPIIFPQFNEMGSGQRHGFARNTLWQGGASGNQCFMTLSDTDATRALWPHKFKAEFAVTVEDSQLRMDLMVENTDTQSFDFSCALHTYLDIGHLPSTQIAGLNNTYYWDNDGRAFSDRSLFNSDTLDFDDAIDRVYFSVEQPLTLHCPKGELRIQQEGFEDVVIWNPGHDAATKMADFGDEEYLQMLCVEAAKIDKPVSLAPGERWKASQILTEL